jgi:hypothetical protein
MTIMLSKAYLMVRSDPAKPERVSNHATQPVQPDFATLRNILTSSCAGMDVGAVDAFELPPRLAPAG